jgi:1-acyl-sn-glycerol-3-phosphate acyltransferase
MASAQGSQRKSIGRRIAGGLLRLAGWHLVFRAPPAARAVVVFYPHTSNWDFVIGILARSALDFPVRWAGKDTLFRWPFAGLLRHLGGIPVNRRQTSGLVGQLCQQFARADTLYLAIAPEGTRSRTEHWKSGFYHLARAAGVPLGLAFIDYARREIGVDTYLETTGDVSADLAALGDYYATKRGRHPHLQGPIRFRSDPG